MGPRSPSYSSSCGNAHRGPVGETYQRRKARVKKNEGHGQRTYLRDDAFTPIRSPVSSPLRSMTSTQPPRIHYSSLELALRKENDIHCEVSVNLQRLKGYSAMMHNEKLKLNTVVVLEKIDMSKCLGLSKKPKKKQTRKKERPPRKRRPSHELPNFRGFETVSTRSLRAKNLLLQYRQRRKLAPRRKLKSKELPAKPRYGEKQSTSDSEPENSGIDDLMLVRSLITNEPLKKHVRYTKHEIDEELPDCPNENGLVPEYGEKSGKFNKSALIRVARIFYEHPALKFIDDFTSDTTDKELFDSIFDFMSH